MIYKQLSTSQGRILYLGLILDLASENTSGRNKKVVELYIKIEIFPQTVQKILQGPQFYHHKNSNSKSFTITTPNLKTLAKEGH